MSGEKYRVFKKPDHLLGVQYPYRGEVGECIWTNKDHGVNMRFNTDNGIVERIIPFNCLEETEPTVLLTPNNVIMGNFYRIKSAPKFWAESPQLYALLGRIGKLIKLSPTHRPIAILEIKKGEQRCIPLDDLEPVITIITAPPINKYYSTDPIMDLTDDILIDKIIANPKGCLKLVKGLAKMNKDPRLKTFLERGYV